MQQQHTLKQVITFAGVGLHSGNKVNMTFIPAPPNSGIRFKRVDLEGTPEIEARTENIAETNRSTTLARGNVKVQTVEHVLSAFAGLGVDNAIVELDANEPPIGDGSSSEYAKMIRAAGLEPQAEKRDVYRVTAPLHVTADDTTLSILPHDGFKISCTSSDRQGRFTQFFSVDVTPENWQNELSAARTFCFFDELEYLIRNGLIKGGSLENAVVIRDDAVLTNEPLRYPEEFVRHKILDIIGDLSLVGKPIQGHVIAVKPSHSGNCDLARQIVTQMRKPEVVARTFTPPPPPAGDGGEVPAVKGEGQPLMDIMDVMKTLPHRYPFLMVDRVMLIDGNRIVAHKNVTINEQYFQGHFPGHPIMPGVLQLEAIAQTAGILMLKRLENMGKIAYFMSAENVKWRNPVRPGDILVIDVELVKSRGKIGKAKGVCSVNGTVVSEADVAFIMMQG